MKASNALIYTCSILGLAMAGIGCEDDRNALYYEDSDTDSEVDTDGEEKGEQDSDDPCDPFPESFSEGAAFAFNDPNLGEIVQYTEFDGLVEGHAYADAIFDLAIFETFGAVFEAGTIDLSGRESSFDTCAYCLRFSVGVTMKNGQPVSTEHIYMPKSGTLAFESLSNRPGDLLKFRVDAEMGEVTIGQNSQSIPVEGGCTFRLDNYTRTAMIKN